MLKMLENHVKTQQNDFLPLKKKKKKTAFLIKFDIKTDYLTHFYSRNVYFYIHRSYN